MKQLPDMQYLYTFACIQLTCQQQNRKQQIYFVFGSMLSFTQFLPNRFNIIFQALLLDLTKHIPWMLHIQYSGDEICFKFFFVCVHTLHVFNGFCCCCCGYLFDFAALLHWYGWSSISLLFSWSLAAFFRGREHCNNILYLIQHLPIYPLHS